MPDISERLQDVRGDLVTARETINRAIAGNEADLETSSGLLDQALEALCQHDPDSRFESYADTGRLMSRVPSAT